MVSPISSRPPEHRVGPPPVSRPAAPGRSADSVGRLAKEAIAASGNGAALPANIHGQIASHIARALDYGPLLAPQPPPEATDPAPDPAPAITVPAATEGEPVAT